MPWVSLTFCSGSRAVWPFSTRKTNTIEDLTPKVAKVSYFTVHFAPPPRAARIRRPLSRIRPGRALRRGKGATRRKRRRQNTVLSERRLRRSRARGWVDFRNCQHYREWGQSDRAMAANLRKIRSVRFGNGEHYPGSGPTGRARRANYLQNGQRVASNASYLPIIILWNMT